MHTNELLAIALREAGLQEMARKAASGYYHDFMSPLAMPEMQLITDLMLVGTPAALALRKRAINGDFDATKEESDDWAQSEDGQLTMHALFQGLGKS